MSSVAANTEGTVRSRKVIPTLNHGHSSQATNNTSLRPSITGPSPKLF